MSDRHDDRPTRRRRIAGENAQGAGGSKPPARRVVKRPVARPGAPKASEPTDDLTREPDVVADETEATDETEAADETAESGVDGGAQQRAPQIVPAGRRSGRARKKTEPEPESKIETEAADDSAGEDDPTRTPDDEGTARSGRLRAALGVLVVVLALVFALGASAWAVQQVRGGAGLEAAQAEAAAAAATASEQILGYRYDQLDEHLEDAQALMTDSFAEEFESISPALNDLAPQRQVVVEATARDAAPMPCGDDCSSDAADVLVFIDQARVADGDQEPTVFGNRISLSMVQQDGEWLVDDIEAY